MKVTNDSTRVFDAKPQTTARAQQPAARAAAPKDSVQISALAEELSAADQGSPAKVKELKHALATGKNIVDSGRIADGIMADAFGEV
ncbi:MAG: flagellar biosynthesis anti-sigma factor FlgM [Deltaproteobacteria bacterium]|nr:flagellar biosynthesis anti-sigma factor FlgM [Deltaproteobacteria bacterium]